MNATSDNTPRLFTKTKLIGLIIGIVLFFVFALNLPGFNMPQHACSTAGVVLMMASFWISQCLPIPVTSLIPIVLYPVLGIAKSAVTVEYYADNNIYLFLGGFIIALAIEKWNLHRRIALTITALLGASPGKIVMGFMCGTAFMSMWVSNTATAMIMLPIGLAVISEIGKENTGPNFAIVLMLGIAYAASLGGIATPIGTPPNILFLGVFNDSFPHAPAISFFSWIIAFVPLTIILIPITWLVLVKLVFPLTHKTKVGREVIRKELQELGRMDSAEKRVLAIFVLAALLWIFRSDINLGFATIPGWSNILPNPKFAHDATVAILMAIILFVIPAGKHHRGQFLMDWQTAVKLPWGILLLFGGGFAIAGGFTASGLDKQIGMALKPYLVFHPLIIVFIVCIILTFLTELTSNTATAAALLPIMKGTAVALNLNPLLLMIPATISASMAFMLPVATPPNAIVFSSGKIEMGQMARAGLILNIVIACIVACFVYFYVLPLWGYSASMPAWAN
jgi:sodium-dependent dicarboxylate transporter 2/3/5